MKKYIMNTLLGFGILSLVIFAASPSFAVPQYINYQGVLRDSANALQTGSFSMQFKIYDALTSGTALYDSGSTTVVVNNGIYNVALGPVTTTIFNGDDRWLEVAVQSPTTSSWDTLTPRLKINSVAYAISAGAALTAETATSATTATTATTALNAEKLGGLVTKEIGEIGSGSFIPITNSSSGKLDSSVLPTSGSTTLAAYSLDSAKLGGKSTSEYTASSVYVPVTTSTGKLNASIIATAEMLAGRAITAETVDNIHASTTATASYLYPLDGNGGITLNKNSANTVITASNEGVGIGVYARSKSGVAISAESDSGVAIYAKTLTGTAISVEAPANKTALNVSGRLKASICAGAGTISLGQKEATISNGAVSTNSLIFLTIGNSDDVSFASTSETLTIKSKASGSNFVVQTGSGNNASADIPFYYLIIN